MVHREMHRDSQGRNKLQLLQRSISSNVEKYTEETLFNTIPHTNEKSVISAIKRHEGGAGAGNRGV